jgi:hypothetical protein
MKLLTLGTAALAIMGCANLANAQLAINWYTVDSGGGMNLTAGTLSLSGTIGQPDASTVPLSGGSLSITGGFWAIGTSSCPCAADFDNSGGTPDAGDIDAFFASWLMGEPSSDVDCSGGTPDAGDIDVFFLQWLAGGC